MAVHNSVVSPVIANFFVSRAVESSRESPERERERDTLIGDVAVI